MDIITKNLLAALKQTFFSTMPNFKCRYVQSTHARASDTSNQGLKPDYPLKTIAKAHELSADYDTIIVLPGHVETVSAAGGLTISKKVVIKGLGHKSVKPQIKVGTLTTASVLVSASNASFENLSFVCDIDSLVKMVDVTGSGNRFRDCTVVDSASKQSLIAFNVATGAAKNVFEEIDTEQETAGAVSCISLAGVCDRTTIRNCRFKGDYSGAPVDVLGAATNLFIHNNSMWNLNATSNKCVQLAAAASTGELSLNRCRNQTDASVAWITMGAGSLVWLIENYGVNNNQETGKIVGTASV